MDHNTDYFLLREFVLAQPSGLCRAVADGNCGRVCVSWSAGVLLADRGAGSGYEEREEWECWTWVEVLETLAGLSTYSAIRDDKMFAVLYPPPVIISP
jgi:hypothetical protein